MAPWIVGRPCGFGFPGKLAFVFAAKYEAVPGIAAVLMWKPPPSTCVPSIPGGAIFPSACSRNAFSTASMHSGKPSRATTSDRVRSRVLRFVTVEPLVALVAEAATSAVADFEDALFSIVAPLLQ